MPSLTSLSSLFQEFYQSVLSSSPDNKSLLVQLFYFANMRGLIIKDIKVDANYDSEETRDHRQIIRTSGSNTVDPDDLVPPVGMFQYVVRAEKYYTCDMLISFYYPALGRRSVSDTEIFRESFKNVISNDNEYSSIGLTYNGWRNTHEVRVHGKINMSTLDWICSKFEDSSLCWNSSDENSLFYRSDQARHDRWINSPQPAEIGPGHYYAPYMPVTRREEQPEREQRYERPKDISEEEWNFMSFLMQEYIIREVGLEDV